MSPRQITSVTRTSINSGKTSNVAIIAEAYLDSPRSVSYPTTPGRRVSFYAGYARIGDEKDLPAVLRRDDLTVYPDPRYKDWWANWINSCGEHQPARAKIEVDGVVHLPPYATLFDAQPPEEAAVSEYQGAVLPLKRGPGRPPKAWS